MLGDEMILTNRKPQDKPLVIQQARRQDKAIRPSRPQAGAVSRTTCSGVRAMLYLARRLRSR